MTFLERFTTVKECLEKKNTQKCEERFAIQVTMTDEDGGGVFYIANTEEGFFVEPYDYKDFTAHVIVDSQVLMGILNGTEDPVKAYLDGKVKAEGNLEHIKLIAALKEKPKRRAPAKKATEKKTTAKKTTAKKKEE